MSILPRGTSEWQPEGIEQGNYWGTISLIILSWHIEETEEIQFFLARVVFQ